MADLQTKAVVSEAFELDGFLHVIIEIYVEDKATPGEKLKVLTRTQLDPMPIDATDKDIEDAAAGLLEKYFPEAPKVKTSRDDLIGLEVGVKDGVKEGTSVRIS